MSAYKSSNGTWYIKYHNKTKRGFKTKVEAQRYEAKMRLNIIADSNIGKYSLYAKEYILNRYKAVSYGTYEKSNNAIQNIILPNIPDKPINEITKIDCKEFKDKIIDMQYSSSHTNYIFSQFKAVFKYAEEYYEIKNNCYEVIKKVRSSDKEIQNKRNKELNIWNVDTFHNFIKHVKKENYKMLFIILYFTGLRLGEALALTWNDFDGKTLNISKSISRKTDKGKYIVKQPKNIFSIRNIALGNNIANLLSEYLSKEEKICGFRKEWFIFGRLEPLPQTTIDKVKESAINSAKVRRIRIHDFRHSHASNLIASGVNIVAVSRRLGHADINMTLKIYTHLLKQNEDELISQINNSSQFLLKQ